MLNDTREIFWNAITAYPWVSSLANILPLSALLDFLDTPRMLHAYELNGVTPLWCWPISPAGSRVLVSKSATEGTCYLDKFGSSPSLYNAASPETLRLCLATAPITIIPNHDMASRRVQKIKVVQVSSLPNLKQPSCEVFTIISMLGYAILISLFVFCGLMYCWVSLAFLIVLRPDPPGIYNRLVIAALHLNETEWLAFYGESVLANSLLNHPLQPGRSHTKCKLIYNDALRVLILSQWALVIGAAALQAWDAYIVTFWILFCILSNTFVFSPERCAKDWAKRTARGRRALLNTMMALNPDTFGTDKKTNKEDYGRFSEGGLAWMDPILKRSPDRTAWEEATRRAMVETKNKALLNQGSKTIAKYKLEDGRWANDYREYWWTDPILEGIGVAEKIIKQVKLTRSCQE
ncbi:hypothetical protein F5Y02DRAFT_425191 [Annulohypoxylon stygium]|nr:hypothetical protein F5Y02DRAFT_425191 [Annulohypoxylon stygium]